MRFSRALKLIRVSRVGRLMDWCILYLGLPFRSVVMLKCGLVFFFTLHWGCVESDRRFGTSRPRFEMLSLGHIEVDSADFWTNRSLSSSSRIRAEALVSNRSSTRTLQSG
jgi:hypothetical protein